MGRPFVMLRVRATQQAFRAGVSRTCAYYSTKQAPKKPFPPRQDTAYDRPTKKAFPSRQDSVDTLKQRDFVKLAKQFGSFGQFANYCREHQIELTREERKNVMSAVWNLTDDD